MKASEWERFCLENRRSKKQKDIMLNKRINQKHEERLVRLFKENESRFFVIVALDTSRRHEVTFIIEDYKGHYVRIFYNKKLKRFTDIAYEEYGCWHHIFLKNSIYLANEKQNL